MNKLIALALASAAVLCCAVTSVTGQGVAGIDRARLLDGAIDVHVHRAARLGAMIEFVGGSLTTPDAETRMNRYSEAIRQIGPEFCVVSSDLGQPGNALPPDGFGDFLVSLRRRGFTAEEVDRMAKQNPARLLGLP